MENIEVKIETKHFKASPGYIFDDSPLDLALRDMFPKAFVLTGGTKVTIIHDKYEDKEALVYTIGKEDYHPRTIDNMVKTVKEEGGEANVTIILTFKGKMDNYFYHKPNEDHVEKTPQLPKDLFSE